ncbi:MAG: hypothetical protein H7A53_04475 [Akkermansiaceae bacterium]|nr:hypothetical protein [Akkermansiaceae bacterium]
MRHDWKIETGPEGLHHANSAADGLLPQTPERPNGWVRAMAPGGMNWSCALDLKHPEHLLGRNSRGAGIRERGGSEHSIRPAATGRRRGLVFDRQPSAAP